MPFNGSGSFSPPGADFPAVATTLIESSKFNSIINDIATGLSTCWTKDGQTTITANQAMSGFKFTGLGAGTANGNSIRYEQLFTSGLLTLLGTLKAPTTIGVGAATPAASGAGVSFPATQSASSDANTLDDYEEGTWTPSVGGDATYTARTGAYTKIGNMVNLRFTLVINVLGTGSANTITGAPFASSLDSFGAVKWLTVAANYMSIITRILASDIILFGTTAAAATISTANALANGADIGSTITYGV